jgi:hypothetical protein
MNIEVCYLCIHKNESGYSNSCLHCIHIAENHFELNEELIK